MTSLQRRLASSSLSLSSRWGGTLSSSRTLPLLPSCVRTLSFIASPENPITHNELFTLSTKFFYGRPRSPLHVPKLIAYPGVIAMDGRHFTVTDPAALAALARGGEATH